MSIIKQRRLDCFRMNTSYISGRLIRHILKRYGDAALVVLLQIYCCIYSNQGYYVLVDCLYQQEAATSTFCRSERRKRQSERNERQ